MATWWPTSPRWSCSATTRSAARQAAEGPLRGELRSVGGEILGDPVGQFPAHGGRPVGHRGRSLVPESDGDPHPESGARSLLLAALQSPDRQPARFRGGRRGRHQLSRPDRSPRPEELPGDPLGTVRSARAADRSASHGRAAGRETGESASQQTDPDLPGGHPGAAGRHRVDHHLAAGREHRYLFHHAARYALEIPDAHRPRILPARLRRPEAPRAERRDHAAQVHRPGSRARGPTRSSVFSGGLEGERFVRAGQEGNRLDYLVRHGDEIWVYSTSLGDVAHGPADARDPRCPQRGGGGQRARSAARHQEHLRAAGRRDLAGLARAAGLPGAPHQPSHPGTDRRSGRSWPAAT